MGTEFYKLLFSASITIATVLLSFFDTAKARIALDKKAKKTVFKAIAVK